MFALLLHLIKEEIGEYDRMKKSQLVHHLAHPQTPQNYGHGLFLSH